MAAIAKTLPGEVSTARRGVRCSPPATTNWASRRVGRPEVVLDGIEALAVSTHAPEAAAKGTGLVLLTLASGQFLMTLDSSVMNVSIATVAKDVGTTVTGIQTAITMYPLVMAMFMVTGGKVSSIIGRRRAFAIGCVI
jgi:MFS transporter